MLSAWLEGTTPRLRLCEAQAGSCASGTWADVTPAGAFDDVRGAAVTATHAFALFRNDTGKRAVLFQCPLSSGCDAAPEWTAITVQASATYDPRPTPAYSADNDTLYVAVQDDTPALDIKRCAAASCGAMTTLTTTSGPFLPDTLAVTSSLVLAANTSSFRSFDGVSWESGSISAFGFSPQPYGTHAAIASDGQAVLTLLSNNQLYAVYCAHGLEDCRLNSSWGSAKLGNMPTNDGVAVDVVAAGDTFTIAYRNSGQTFVKQCREGCHDPNNWRGGEVSRDRFMVSAKRNLRFFWKDPTTKLYGMGYYGRGLQFLDTGKTEGPF